MAEASRFFDSTPEDERYYSADEFAEYFRRLLTNGIFNGGINLKVDCDGNNIQTYVQEGFAWLEGYMYKVQDEPFYLTHDLPDIQNDRIDRIVLRLDKSLEVRSINAKILKGMPAASPVVPALTRNDNVYELGMAQVRIIAGKSYIEGYQITDERLNTSACGLVNSLIQADTTEIFNQFQAWYNSKTIEFQNEWNDWFTTATAQFGQEWTTWFTATKQEWEIWKNEQSGIPPGIIAMWSGAHANIPFGWNICDGQNGTPDLRDRFILGATTEVDIGETGGSHEVTLTESQMPSHSHSGSTNSTGSHRHAINWGTGSGGSDALEPAPGGAGKYSSAMDYAGSHTHTLTINSAGGDQPHENRPAFYKLAFIMKS